MRLTLVISALTGGGAERVITLLANGWAGQGVDVSLITLGPISDDAYDLHGNITRVGLDLLRQSEGSLSAVLNNIQRVRRLRVAIREQRPDGVVSFMTATNVLSVIAAKQLQVPIIVSERTWPEADRVGKAWGLLRKYAYRRATVVVAQTRRAADWLQGEIPGAAIEVIANPVQVDSAESMDVAAETVLTSCHNCKLVLAAGRLSAEKGFDLLIRAFAPLTRRRADWRLAIFGEGPERNALEGLSRNLGISNRVFLPGFSRAIRLMMRKAELFVLPSRHEGMPNALVEAMASGAPCISFDCPVGPAELISNGDNGLLVPAEDVPGLISAMDRLMEDEVLRRDMGSAARESAKVYSLDTVLSQWNGVLTRQAKGGSANETGDVGVEPGCRRS